MKKKIKIICTLGPSSFNKNILHKLSEEKIDLYRINLSHTNISDVSKRINYLKKNNIMKNLGFFDKDYGSCKPVLYVEYTRDYFKYGDIRVTIDNDISYFTKYRKFLGFDKNQIIELKASFKKDLNELMKDFPFPRSRFSKYTNGVEKLMEY